VGDAGTGGAPTGRSDDAAAGPSRPLSKPGEAEDQLPSIRQVRPPRRGVLAGCSTVGECTNRVVASGCSKLYR
jgi:hypothetical protein